MKGKFFFSVIVNTHDSNRTISSTLKSIFQQDFKDFEIILVDDHSVDGTIRTVDKLKKSTDLPFMITSLKKNMGISYARNLGIKMARGEYIAFVDGDDVWKKNKLQREHDLLSENKVNWVFSNYEVINEKYEHLYDRVRQSGEYSYKDIINSGNPVGLLTVAVSSDILKRINFRNVRHEDYDLWIRLSKAGYKGYLIDEKLAQYMIHKDSISSNKIKSALWTYSVFRKNQIGIFESWLLIFRYAYNVIRRNR